MNKSTSKDTKKSFIVYSDWGELVEALGSDEEAGKLFKALLGYAANGDKPKLTGALGMAFLMMTQQIDRDTEKWEKTRQSRRDAAYKRWEVQEDAKNANAYKSMQKYANDAVNVTVTDTVNATGTGNVNVTDTGNVTDNVTENVIGNATENVDVDVNGSVTGAVDVNGSVTANVPPKALRTRAPRDTSAPRFTPPTPTQIQEFCSAEGLNIDPWKFINYYTSTGWRVGSSPMRDWRAALRTWARRDRERGYSPGYSRQNGGGYSQMQGGYSRQKPACGKAQTAPADPADKPSYDLEKWYKWAESVDLAELKFDRGEGES